MKLPVKTLRDEDGFVLITGLLILLILTLLGITATRNTSIELQIAGNDRLHKETFYSAESGAILGTELLEQNFNCVTGFTKTNNTLKIADLEGQIRVFERREDRSDPYSDMNNLAFYTNHDFIQENFEPADDAFYVPNIAEADVAFPKSNLDPGGNPDNDLPGTNYLYIAGRAHMLPGGALQMAAGYERKGKGAAGGGVAKIMDIYSQHMGPRNSEAIIMISWRHLTDTLSVYSKYCPYP
jgi:hypothetical protein